MTGIVVSVIPPKGICFIKGDADELTYFANAKESFKQRGDYDRVREGMNVKFTPFQGKPTPTHNGLRALNIELL